MEQENQQLKMANLKQMEQILLLQDKLQGEGSSVRHLLITFVHELQILPACRSGSLCRFDVSRCESFILLLWSAALLEKPGSPATSPVVDTHLVPSSPLFPPSCPGTPPAQDEGRRQACPRGAKPSPGGALPLIYCLGFEDQEAFKAVCLCRFDNFPRIYKSYDYFGFEVCKKHLTSKMC